MTEEEKREELREKFMNSKRVDAIIFSLLVLGLWKFLEMCWSIIEFLLS